MREAKTSYNGRPRLPQRSIESYSGVQGELAARRTHRRLQVPQILDNTFLFNVVEDRLERGNLSSLVHVNGSTHQRCYAETLEFDGLKMFRRLPTPRRRKT